MYELIRRFSSESFRICCDRCGKSDYKGDFLGTGFSLAEAERIGLERKTLFFYPEERRHRFLCTGCELRRQVLEEYFELSQEIGGYE